MLILATLLLGQVGSGTPGASRVAPPPCTVRQLAISVNGKDGEFNGMEKSGTELSIRNHRADCTLPALPRIDFLDARGRPLPVSRAAPVGMHPGPVMIPVLLAGGHRAAADLSWITGPVYDHNRPLRVAYLRVTVGGGSLRTRLADVVNTQPDKPGSFSQPPLRAMEGMGTV